MGSGRRTACRRTPPTPTSTASACRPRTWCSRTSPARSSASARRSTLRDLAGAPHRRRRQAVTSRFTASSASSSWRWRTTRTSSIAVHAAPLRAVVDGDRRIHARAPRRFLHKGAWHKFKGYAYSQLNKIQTKSPTGKRAELVEAHGYDVKFAYHVVRLLLEVEQILVAGDIDLECDREQLKAIRRGEWTLPQLSNSGRRTRRRRSKRCTTPAAFPTPPTRRRSNTTSATAYKMRARRHPAAASASAATAVEHRSIHHEEEQLPAEEPATQRPPPPRPAATTSPAAASSATILLPHVRHDPRQEPAGRLRLAPAVARAASPCASRASVTINARSRRRLATTARPPGPRSWSPALRCFAPSP